MPAPKPWASMEMTHAIKFAKNWFTKKFMFFQRERTGLTAIVPSGYSYSGGYSLVLQAKGLNTFQVFSLRPSLLPPYDPCIVPVYIFCACGCSPPSFVFIRASVASVFPASRSCFVSLTLSLCSLHLEHHFLCVSPLYAYSLHLHGM